MDLESPFRHQRYTPTSSVDVKFLTAAAGPQPGTHGFREDIRQAGRLMFDAGVRTWYLIHGTFVGTDASGWIRRISRVVPHLGSKLGRIQKRAVDTVLSDYSNYSDEFESLIKDSQEDSARVDVRRFHWSSENHHIGRADGAIRLLGQLLDEPADPDQRIVLWGHSHGGNLLALLSQILAATPKERQTFFDATARYYRTSRGRYDLPVWERVREACRKEQPLKQTLDVVTFGTPVRYGWNLEAVCKLTHFIYHRPFPGRPPDRARFPFDRDEFRCAAGGDYIQQMALAGTDFSPGLTALRARQANRALEALLQQGVHRRDLFFHLHHGQRTHEDGTNLLVDYGQQDDNLLSHMAGHAIYTMTEWLHFHMTTVANLYYA